MASLSGVSPFPPATPGSSERRADLLWALGAAILSTLVGVLASLSPAVLAAVFAAVAATAAFVSRPLAVLAGVLLVRAGLDGTDSLANLGVATIEGAVGVLVFVGGTVAVLVSGARLHSRIVTLALLAGLFLTLLSLLWSPDQDEGLRTWLHHGGIAAMFLVAAASVRKVHQLRLLVTATLFAAIVPTVVGLGQLATGSGYTRQGFSAIDGTFTHSNGFAFFLMIVLTLAMVTMVEARRGWERVLSGGLIVLGGAAFIVTYTRSAWIAIVVILLLMAALQYRRLWAVGFVALVIAVLSVPSGVGLVEDRFADLSSESSRYSDNSASWREENWSRMFHFAAERPLHGWGVSSYPVLAIREFGTTDQRFAPKDEDSAGVYAHNDYLRLAVEVGVPGLLLWLAVLGGLCSAMWRARQVERLRPYATAMFAVMVAVILIGAVDNMQDYTAVMFYLAALCGGVIGAAAGETANPESAEPG